MVYDQTMNLMLQLLRKRRIHVTAALISCGLTAAMTLWWNSLIAVIINSASAGIPLFPEMIITAIALMAGNGITAYIKNYVCGYACENMAHDLRTGYAKHFSCLPLAETEKLNTGRELSKLQNEINDVSVYLNNNLFQLTDDIVKFITTFIWLFIIDSRLTVMANAPVFLIVIYIIYSSRIISRATAGSQEAKGKMNVQAETLLALFPVIRLYSAENMLLAGYSKAAVEWELQTIKSEHTQARLMSLSGALQTIPLMLIFLFGGAMAIKGEMTIGTLYVFINLSGNVSGVMMNMPGFISAFRQFAANMSRISPKIKLTGDME